MAAASALVRSQYATRETPELLRQPVTVLLGVNAAAATALTSLDITSVFDLATSGVFAHAVALVRAATDPRDPVARHGLPPADVLDASAAGLSLEQLPLAAPTVLQGFGANTATALDVATVAELAAWPPYLAARRLLEEAWSIAATPDQDGVPRDLQPGNGEFPTEQVMYSTLVIDQLDHGQANLVDLAVAKPIDILAVTHDAGFKAPARGALLTFSQRWYTQGVTLGQLLHSVALAPGESTRIAMIDWSRRSRAGTTESIAETEDLDNATTHSRALSEVQNAVASETQSGFSKTSTKGSSAQGGGGLGFSLGPVTLGGSASGSSASSEAMSFSSSSGQRELAASMTQKVNDATHQHASAVRNRRASIVREVSQSEHEAISTRVVANYNHMHALTVQYYEVVQIYRVSTRLHRTEPVLFVPMELIDFSDQAVIDRFKAVLVAAALDANASRLLTRDYGVVEIVPAGSGRSLFDHVVARSGVPLTIGLTARAAALTDTPVDTPTAAAMVTRTAPVAGVARGLVLDDVDRISGIVGRPILRPDTDTMTVPDDVELLGVRVEGSTVGTLRLVDHTGREVGAETTVRNETMLTRSTRLADLAQLFITTPDEDDEISTVVLLLSYLGQRFPVTVRVRIPKGRAAQPIIRFGGVRASDELKAHLTANRLHYSQAVWRSLDSAAIALLLSPYSWEGRPLAEQVDSRPVTITGNYLVFKSHAPTRDQHGALTAWGEWLEAHGAGETAAAAAVSDELVPIPSGGVFAEAVLGRANSAEKLDITRFWNWQDSPIPIQAPEIAAIQAGSRSEAENLTPGQLSAPVVSIVNPTALPDPSGLGGILGALANGNMFRDMSGLAATVGLANTALQQAAAGATNAGQLASNNLGIAAQKEIEMAKIAAQVAGAAMGVPTGGGTSSASVSEKGALLNQAQQLDQQGVSPSTGSGGGGTGSSDTTGGTPGDGGGGPNGETGGGDGGGGNGRSFQGDTMDAINWGSFGSPTRALFDGTMPGMILASAGGSGATTKAATSAAVKKMITDAADSTIGKADRAKSLVNAIIDQYYSGQKEMVSSVVYKSDQQGLLTTASTSPTAKGKITVGDDFVNGMTERLAGRRILQVGHELQHIGQQRQGLGGPSNSALREFLAHAWATLQPDPTGTVPMPHAMRVAMCDAALGNYYCMPEDKRNECAARRDEVLKVRAQHDGKGGNPNTSPPTTCTQA